MVTLTLRFATNRQDRSYTAKVYRLAFQALGSIEHQSGFRIDLEEMPIWLFDRVMQKIRDQLGPSVTDDWFEFRWHESVLVVILT